MRLAELDARSRRCAAQKVRGSAGLQAPRNAYWHNGMIGIPLSQSRRTSSAHHERREGTMDDKDLKGRAGLTSAIGNGLSRRTLIRNAGAFGVVGALMSAYAGNAAAAGYDPKKYAGTKLNILMTGDENDHRALGDLLPAARGRNRHQAGDHLAGARRLDREDAAEPQGRQVELRPHRVSRLPHHPAGGRRLFRAAQQIYRRRQRNPAGLGLQGLHPGGDEERRLLRHEGGRGRPGHGRLWHSRPAFGLGDLFLPQGPVRRRRSQAGQDLGRIQGRGAEAAQGRRRGLQLHRRQRLLARRGRLVHPLHHDRRRADERRPEGQDLQAERRIAGSRRRPADADRPAALSRRRT